MNVVKMCNKILSHKLQVEQKNFNISVSKYLFTVSNRNTRTPSMNVDVSSLSLTLPSQVDSFQQCCVSYRNQTFVLLFKTNDWFLFETQHWAETKYRVLFLYVTSQYLFLLPLSKSRLSHLTRAGSIIWIISRSNHRISRTNQVSIRTAALIQLKYYFEDLITLRNV